MTLAALAPTDHVIQLAVQDEPGRTSDVDAASIGVAVDDLTVRPAPAVTISRTVSSWQQRRAAERATRPSPSITHLQNDVVVTSY